jgi:adenylate cyclase
VTTLDASHNTPDDTAITLDMIERCFSGAIPAVLATASADGVPNVTYLSRAHKVDDERLALSNQFMSKTARNLAENPRASLLLMDPQTHDEFRLTLTYERTERRGHVFDRLRSDVDAIAALTGMQDVFRLRAADIFRVTDVVRIPPNPGSRPFDAIESLRDPSRDAARDLAALAELTTRLGRATDLDVLVDLALDGLGTLLGYEHTHLLLLDEEGRRLYTIGSRGFEADSIGAEVQVGDGLIGAAAARCSPMSVGDLLQMGKYARAIRTQFEEHGGVRSGREVPMPGLVGAASRIVVPAKALGELVGVLVVDSSVPAAFADADEHVLGVVVAVLASSIEHLRALERDDDAARSPVSHDPPPASAEATASDERRPTTAVRFFAVDGSTFLDGQYLIKGVAGRILWSLLRQHVADRRVDFTNKELRLDPTLDLPGFKDNLESRLILLKRRLDERDAPFRIRKTGRGRFRLEVLTDVRLDARLDQDERE